MSKAKEAILEKNAIIASVVRPVIESKGLELFDVKQSKEFGELNIIVLVDCEKPMDLDQILEISELVGQEMDKHENIIAGPYNLSVESVGVEKEIRNEAELEKAVGKHIFVIMKNTHEGINDMYGDLATYADGILTLEYKDKTRTKKVMVPYENIKFARLAIKF